MATLTDGQVSNWKFLPDGRVDLPRTLAGVDHFRRDPGLVNPRSFAPSGRACSGWRPACSWATWPSAGSRPTWTGSANPRSTSGGSSAARTWPAASEYMEKLKSRKAEVDEQLDRTRAAARAAEAEVAAVVPGHAHVRTHRRAPARRRRRPASRTDRPSAKAPAMSDAPEGGREGELHEPAAQGQAARLGRAGEGQQGQATSSAANEGAFELKIESFHIRNFEFLI